MIAEISMPMIEGGVSFWDWLVIAGYFAFILMIGVVFRRACSDTSEYFRGGGSMTWWMAGTSAIIATIGSFVFVGGAARMYNDGFFLPAYWSSAIVVMPLLFYFGRRFRRMRVITPMQAVKRRYGRTTEQLVTWAALPFGLAMGALGLNMVAVFFSSALKVPVIPVIIGIGIITTTMAVLGGSWSVVASDFIQGIVSLAAVIVLIFLALRLPEVGGFEGWIEKMPEEHTNFAKNCRPEIVVLWFVMMVFNRMLGQLHMSNEGARWLCIKDETQVNKMVILLIVAALITPWLYAVPPMVAKLFMTPEMLDATFNGALKNPEEGAVVALAFHALPPGILGILLVGVFATEMTTMDTGLNRNSGIFVKNVYLPLFNKHASEENQLMVGKVATAAFGLIIIGICLGMETFRSLNLFDFAMVLGILLGGPMLVPMTLGLVIKRTPLWSGWSTILVGFVTSLTLKELCGMEYPLAQHIADWMNWGILTTREVNDLHTAVMAGTLTAVTAGWFFFTMLFYKKSKQSSVETVDAFFEDMNTPIDHAAEGTQNHDAMQYRVMGQLCMVYGGFLLLGMLIPGGMTGRLSFLFIGGVIIGIGGLLYLGYLKRVKQEQQEAPDSTDVSE